MSGGNHGYQEDGIVEKAQTFAEFIEQICSPAFWVELGVSVVESLAMGAVSLYLILLLIEVMAK